MLAWEPGRSRSWYGVGGAASLHSCVIMLKNRAALEGGQEATQTPRAGSAFFRGSFEALVSWCCGPRECKLIQGVANRLLATRVLATLSHLRLPAYS